MITMPYSEGYRNPYYSSTHCTYSYEVAKCNVINVTGSASVLVDPDIAIITIGVITQDKDNKIAAEENFKNTEKIITALETAGIKEKNIKTQTYYVEPQYDYIDENQVFKAYTVVNNLKVIIEDITKVGNIIDVSLKNGVNKINNISFATSNYSLYYNKALAFAIKDAKLKAINISKTIGVIINDIPRNITEKNHEISSEVNKFSVLASQSETAIIPQEIEVFAEVQAIFNY
jgi:uncharacterized protein YggE